MLWVAVFGVLMVGTKGHEFLRGSRIRFPSYEGPPPPPMLDLYTGPRLHVAESQNHPVSHDSPAGFEYNHTPFNPNPQKPPNSNPFADSGHYEHGNSKPYINKHRSPPSRPRESQFHEPQPSPFPTQPIPHGPKMKGIHNASPPQPTPSLSSLIENEPQRHRFSGHRDPHHGERRPNGPRHHGNDGHPPQPTHHEKHLVNDRHPGMVRDEKPFDVPDRHRPTHDRPKGAERYHNQERYPGHSEKSSIYKEKAKIPFNGVKKPLFSPSFSHEKSTVKAPPRAPPPALHDDYAPASDEDSDYYHTKLSEEYYTGMQNTQFAEPPVQTRIKNTKNAQPSAAKPKPSFDFSDMPFNFDSPSYGKTTEPGSPFPSGSSVFPQSEEFGDFFDADWMNDFKGAPTEPSRQGGKGAPKHQKLTTQETKRQPFKQPQAPSYYGYEQVHSYEQGQTKYVNKRNPAQSQKNINNFDNEEEDEKKYYQKPQENSYSDSRAQTDSYYDTQESTEFDFGSSPEFNMQEFNMGPFNFGSGTTKSAGTEWIPINAPNGAIPAKSYEIPAPDLSREFFQSQSQYDSEEFQKTPPSRRPSSRIDKSREHSNVVYGARDKGRQNEGVVSASVMVKQ